MRRMIMLAVPALLAACGVADNRGNESATPAPAADAAANVSVSAPATPAPAGESEAAGLARFRAEWLPACIGGGRDAAPAGTPVERHCACAIDRVMAGRTLAFLEAEQASADQGERFQTHMRACIREIPS